MFDTPGPNRVTNLKFKTCQGSKGIRQWPVNCCTSPLIIHQITTSLDYNQWLKRLDTQLKYPTNQNLLKVPIVPTNYKSLGISVINSPMSVPYLKPCVKIGSYIHEI